MCQQRIFSINKSCHTNASRKYLITVQLYHNDICELVNKIQVGNFQVVREWYTQYADYN